MPRATGSTIARNDRPIKRWISSVRPDCLPVVDSRRMRSPVERGNIPYSAVTHPLPPPLNHGGTRSSTDAVQSTCVSPNRTMQDPSAWFAKPLSSVIARNSSGVLFDGRIRFSKGCPVVGAVCQPVVMQCGRIAMADRNPPKTDCRAKPECYISP